MSLYAPLVELSEPDGYLALYKETYVTQEIKTFDGITVKFMSGNFFHMFKESSTKSQEKHKDQFAWTRLQRINWVKKALADDCADLYAGWDKDKQVFDHSRRICLVNGNYVVVIRIVDLSTAKIITAYLMDSPALDKLRKMPEWKMPASMPAKKNTAS